MRMRKTAPADVPALKMLWREAFGDSDVEIDGFFADLFPVAFGFCAEESGAILAMAYALPVTVLADEEMKKGAYLYAVATAEAQRGKGICAELLGFVEKELRKRYFDCLLLVPADEKLAIYYEKLGFATQYGCELQTLRVGTPRGKALAVSVPDYAGLRETMLFDTPHVQYPKMLLDYEAKRATLYRLELNGGLGCAAARLEGNVAVVEELLPDLRYLPALAAELGAEHYVVRTPGTKTMGCMAKWLSEPTDGPVYLAFAFD